DVFRIDIIALEQGDSPLAETVVRQGGHHGNIYTGRGEARRHVHFTAADIDVELVCGLESGGGLSAEPHHDFSDSDQSHHPSPFTAFLYVSTKLYVVVLPTSGFVASYPLARAIPIAMASA